MAETLEEVCERQSTEPVRPLDVPYGEWAARIFREKWFAMQREAQDPDEQPAIPATHAETLEQIYTREGINDASARRLAEEFRGKVFAVLHEPGLQYRISRVRQEQTVADVPLTTIGDQFYTRDAVLQAMEKAAQEMRQFCASAVEGLDGYGMEEAKFVRGVQTPDLSAILAAMPIPQNLANPPSLLLAEVVQDRDNLRGEFQQVQTNNLKLRIENAELRTFSERLALDKAGLKAELTEARQERDHLKEDFERVVQENRDIRKAFDTDLHIMAGQRDAAQHSAETFAKRAENAEFQRDEIGKKHSAANADIRSLQTQLELTRSNLELAQLGEKNALSDYQTAKKRNAELLEANGVVEGLREQLKTTREVISVLVSQRDECVRYCTDAKRSLAEAYAVIERAVKEGFTP